MKPKAIDLFQCKLRCDECTFGLWVTLKSPSITEIAVAMGLDWVVVDAEHGHLDWKEIAGHIWATVCSDTLAQQDISILTGPARSVKSPQVSPLICRC